MIYDAHMRAANRAVLVLRPDEVRAAMTKNNIATIDDLASAIGVSRATVVRGLSGGHAVGSPLVAGLHLHLGLPLDRIVEAQEKS